MDSWGMRVTLPADTWSPTFLMDFSVTRAYWNLAGRLPNTLDRFTFSMESKMLKRDVDEVAAQVAAKNSHWRTLEKTLLLYEESIVRELTA